MVSRQRMGCVRGGSWFHQACTLAGALLLSSLVLWPAWAAPPASKGDGKKGENKKGDKPKKNEEGKANAKPQPPSTPQAPANPKIWLSDLPEQNVRVGRGEFGKQGSAGFAPTAVWTHGLIARHGLGMFPDSHVEYVLGKKYRTFRATAAMNDTARQGGERPVEFKVLGDGKLLWQSVGLRSATEAQPCLLDISGVEVLALETNFRAGATGSSDLAHAVWVDPYVSAAAPAAEVLSIFSPDRYRALEQAIAVRRSIAEAWQKSDFATLEKITQQARKQDVLTTTESTLEMIYAEIGVPDENTDDGWKKYFEKLDAWLKDDANAATPRIAYGDALTNYAWYVRGAGTADTVKPENWGAFNDRLKRANNYLDAAQKLGVSDPELYAARITVAMGQGRDQEEVLAAVDAGRKIAPGYFPLYARAATFLLPRWHGQPGDVEKFAARMRDDLGGDLGQEIYFRIACSHFRYVGFASPETKEFPFAKLAPGIRALMKLHPENNNLINLAATLAVNANDRPLATLLFSRLDTATFVPSVWNSYAQLEEVREEFDPSLERGEASAVLAGQDGWVRQLAFLFQEGKLVSGGQRASISLWDWKVKVLEHHVPLSRPIRGFAADKEGRFLLVKSGIDTTPDPEANLIDFKDFQNNKVLRGHTAGIGACAITPDASHCATMDRSGLAKLWNVAELDKPIDLPHPERGYDISFSPDGKMLATSTIGGGLWLWETETGKALGEPLAKPQAEPVAPLLRFAPDGKSLYVFTNSGLCRRWNLATRQADETKFPGPGVLSFAVSPDGHWAAIGRDRGTVDLISLESMNVVHTYAGHQAQVLSLLFTPDGKSLVSGSIDCTLRFWPLEPYVKAPQKK